MAEPVEQLEALAASFSQLMRRSLRDDLETIRARNAMPEYAGAVCASHDFVDANIIMAEAFTMLTGQEPEPTNPAHCALWSGAWSLAKASGFR